MSSDQMPAPGKIKLIKFPPPGQEKTSNARGMPGGGMLKFRFDWYIISGLINVNEIDNKIVSVFFILRVNHNWNQGDFYRA